VDNKWFADDQLDSHYLLGRWQQTGCVWRIGFAKLHLHVDEFRQHMDSPHHTQFYQLELVRHCLFSGRQQIGGGERRQSRPDIYLNQFWDHLDVEQFALNQRRLELRRFFSEWKQLGGGWRREQWQPDLQHPRFGHNLAVKQRALLDLVFRRLFGGWEQVGGRG
jgi:hypothetical protein